MFAGDAAGILHELSMDIAPLSGTAAEAFATSMFTTAGRTCNPADANGNSSSGCPCDTAVESLSGGNFSKSPRRYPHPATPRGASATATAEAVSPVAAVIRHGSTVHMMAAGEVTRWHMSVLLLKVVILLQRHILTYAIHRLICLE